MLINLVLSFVMGVALHQIRRYSAILPHGWRDLAHYSIGIFGTFPLFLLWLRRRTTEADRAGIAFLLAFLGVGSGVAAGWLADTFFGVENETE